MNKAKGNKGQIDKSERCKSTLGLHLCLLKFYDRLW